MTATTTRKKKAPPPEPVEAHSPVAPPPARTTSHAVIEIFGLITVEVDLYSACDSSQTSRSMFVEAEDGFHEVGQQLYDKTTGEVVERSDMIKGVVKDGKVIPFSDEEMKALAGEKGVSPILAILPRQSVDFRWLCPNKYYQARPSPLRTSAKKMPNPGNEKKFVLLLAALEKLDAVALIQSVLRDGNAPRFALLDSSGRFSILHYGDDLRQERPFPQVEPSEGEFAQMVKLLELSITEDVPPLRNTQAVRMAELVSQKAAGKAIAPLAEVQPSSAEVDLTSLLEMAIAKAQEDKKKK